MTSDRIRPMMGLFRRLQIQGLRGSPRWRRARPSSLTATLPIHCAPWRRQRHRAVLPADAARAGETRRAQKPQKPERRPTRRWQKFWLFAHPLADRAGCASRPRGAERTRLQLLHRQNLPTKGRASGPTRRAKRSWCSTSNRPTVITPATGTGWRPGSVKQKKGTQQKEHANACSFLPYKRKK